MTTTTVVESGVERWVDEQMFEEDVRAVINMMRPHRRERLAGWREYRTGGSNFRITISWDSDFEREGEMQVWNVRRMAEVLETLLLGSVKNGDELLPCDEFEHYRSVARRLCKRIDEMETCYT